MMLLLKAQAILTVVVAVVQAAAAAATNPVFLDIHKAQASAWAFLIDKKEV